MTTRVEDESYEAGEFFTLYKVRYVEDPGEAYDEVAESYDQTYQDKVCKAEDWVVYRAIRKRYRWLLYSYGTKAVVDLGCATGELLHHVNVRPCDYLGIDASEKMVEVAQHKWPEHTFVHSKVEDLSRTGQRFDLVVATYGTLNYLTSWSELWRALTTMTDLGGHFIIVLYADARRSEVLKQAGIITKMVHHDHPLLVKYLRRIGYRVRWRGLSILADRFQWLPQPLLNAFMLIETHTLGRVAKDKGRYIIMEGWNGDAY